MRSAVACRLGPLDVLRALIVALTVVAPRLAEAQSAMDVETARAMFVEASRLADQGRWEEARVRYTLSLRLRPAAITFYSLGVVDRELGRLVEARESFRAFLDAPSADATQSFQEPARRALVEIDSRLAAARLAESTPPAPPASATVPVTAPATVPVATSATVPVAGPDRTVPFALIGSGGALFVAGAVTGLLGLSQAGNATSTTGPDAESARTKGVVGDVLGGVGLATIGAGVVVLLLQKHPQPAKAAAVRPWIGGTSAGVSIRF